jgi:hypothetical protein
MIVEYTVMIYHLVQNKHDSPVSTKLYVTVDSNDTQNMLRCGNSPYKQLSFQNLSNFGVYIMHAMI